MASRRDALIDELIKLDSTLADNREEIEQLFASLEAARPSVKPSAAFEQTLLTELRKKMRVRNETAPSYFFSPFSFMKYYLFAGGGAVVGAFLVAIAMQTQNALPVSTNVPDETPTSGIVAVEPEAFGSLAVTQDTAAGGARLQSGGGGGSMAPQDGKMMPSDMIVLPPEGYTQTRYTYEGAILLPTEDVQVLRRIKPTNKPSGNSIGKGFAEQMFNWSALSNLQVQNIQLLETGNSPYSVSIDFNEGSLSIYRSFDVSMRPDMGCTDTECYERNRLRESDMLTDDELTRIARNFTDEFGLVMSDYGDPQVIDDWRVWYNASTVKTDYYFPEQVSVVFPLLIDGKPVYEEYGTPYGVSLGIDIRTKSVSNLYNYSFQNYESSAYAPLTDEAKARAMIEKGSRYIWDDPNAKTVRSTLDEPTEGYMHYMQWEPGAQTSKDLIVPALIFPVVEHHPEATDMRANVILPLAAELLEQEDYPIPMPRPIPLIEEGAVPPEDLKAM